MRFTAELWEYASGGWFFVTLPEHVGEELGDGPRHGFGSVRVEVTVGATTWRTSVFPSKEQGYILPMKKQVRVAEGLEPGEVVTVALQPVT